MKLTILALALLLTSCRPSHPTEPPCRACDSGVGIRPVTEIAK